MDKYFDYRDSYFDAHLTHDDLPDIKNFTLHAHDRYELFYFVKGKGIFKIEGSLYPLQSGDILIMRPSESHYIDIDCSVPYTRMSIHFTDEIFDNIDKENKLLLPFLKRPAGRLNLYRSTDFKRNNYQYYIDQLMSDCDDRYLNILVNLFPLLNEIRLSFNERLIEPHTESLIEHVLRYINDNITKNFTLDELCTECFISKSQLYREFKNATGSTVFEYIKAKRLVLAHNMIMCGKHPTEIYSECGFSDYSTFYRTYKKQFGRSPSKELRK